MSWLGDRLVGYLLTLFSERHGFADARQLSEVELRGMRFRFMLGANGMFTIFGFSTAPFDRTVTVLDPEDTKRLAAAMVDAYRETTRLQGK